MKKLLVFLVMIGVVLGMMGMAVGDTGGIQTPEVEISDNIDFTLLDTTLDFGSVIPGQDSVILDNRIQVNENNNVNFIVYIELTVDDSSKIFSNIFLDLDEEGTPEAQLNMVLEKAITDPVEAAVETHNLKAQLQVPDGFMPVVGATGTITYSIIGPAPTP